MQTVARSDLRLVHYACNVSVVNAAISHKLSTHANGSNAASLGLVQPRFTRIRQIFILKNGTAAGSARFSFLKWHSRRDCQIFTFSNGTAAVAAMVAAVKTCFDFRHSPYIVVC